MIKEEKKLVLKTLIWECIEEGGNPLYQHIWALNTLFPKNTPKENQRLASETLKRLYQTKMVEFFYDIWGSNEAPEKINDNGTIHKIFTDSILWEPPAIGGKCIIATATKKGEELYNKSNYDILISN